MFPDTCADLIYKHPALPLLASGIDHFVVPIAWSDEMAQMQALPSLQAWSLAHCVNLVATNHRSSSMSGSGIFSCGHVEAATYSTGGVDGPMYTATLPKHPDRSGWVDPAVAVAVPPMAPTGSNVPWVFARLHATPTQSLCSDSGRVCCTASGLEGGDGSGYVLAALDGDDTGGGITWSGATCAVLACVGTPGPACLDASAPAIRHLLVTPISFLNTLLVVIVPAADCFWAAWRYARDAE